METPGNRSYYISVVLAAAVIAILILSQEKTVEKTGPEKGMSGKTQIVQPDASLPEELSSPVSGSDPDLLLPDLRVQGLKDIRVETGADARKILRFPGTFANVGDGPLELAAFIDEKTGTTEAVQHMRKKDGAKTEKFAGNFILHPDHKHWHFEYFVEFEIHSLKKNKELDQKLAGTGKITFCIHDYAPLPEVYPGKPSQAVFPWCGSTVDVQGISVGWVDTYTADISGQELDITDIPDGTYAFRASVDPENRLLERDENNNVTVTYIEIGGGNVRILP